MQKIILATGNLGKIAELRALLGGIFTVLSQADLKIPEADETAETFVENALIKARNAAFHSGLPAIADDSGIIVDALGGAPGVRSARYASGAQSHTNKLLAALRSVPEKNRSARFWCAMVWMQSADDPMPLIVQRGWEGRILEKKAGGGGFGYDPIFYVPTHQCSAAELSSEEKNKISHRGQATRALVAKIKNQ